MSQQNSKSYALKRAFAAVTLAVVMAGCASIDKVNASLFSGGDDLNSRYAQLRKGMTLAEFRAVMGEEVTRKWQEIDNVTKTAVKCGCELSVKSLAELEEAASRVAGMAGYQITYKNVVKQPHYIGTRKRVDVEGQDLTMRFVFEDGRLSAWDRRGGPVNEHKTTPYVDFNGIELKLLK